MAINEDVAAVGHMGIAGDDNRVSWCIMELCREAHTGEFSEQPLSAGPDVGGMMRIRGDAGETQERKEVFKMRSHARDVSDQCRIPQGELIEIEGGVRI